MANEILYCARCHRLLLPSEVSEGSYHFVDGQPICRACFSRLSRRLTPVTAKPAEQDEQPKPVNLAELEREMSKGAAQVRVGRTERRRDAYGRDATAGNLIQKGFMAAMFLLGTALGAVLYMWLPMDIGRAASPPTVPPPPADGSGTPVTPLDTTTGSPDRTTGPADQPPPVKSIAAVKIEDGAWRVPAAADACVSALGPGRNSGADAQLLLASDGTSVQNMIFLRFDISKLDVQPASARLVLPLFNSRAPDTYRSRRQAVHLVPNSSWDEMKITWANRPEVGDEKQTFFLSISATEADVALSTPMLAALAADRKISLCVTLDSSSVQDRFEMTYASSETGEGKGPALVITPGVPQNPDAEPPDEPKPTQPTDPAGAVETSGPAQPQDSEGTDGAQPPQAT